MRMPIRTAAATAASGAANRRILGESLRRTPAKKSARGSRGETAPRRSQLRAKARHSAHEASWARASLAADGWHSRYCEQFINPLLYDYLYNPFPGLKLRSLSVY